MYRNLEEFKEKYYSFKKNHELRDTYVHTDLCEIMWRNRSDKSYPKELESELEKYRNSKSQNKKTRSFHNYTTFYSEFFSKFKSDSISIFEVGLGSNTPGIEGWMGAEARPGASVYGWSEYFEKGEIYGADIDKNAIFKDEKKRIATYYMDQKNKKDVEAAFRDIGKKVDIIIDDGMHRPLYSKRFFDNSIEFLNDGGLFIVEDLFLASHPKDLQGQYYENLEYIRAKVRFADILKLKSDLNSTDNNLMVILK